LLDSNNKFCNLPSEQICKRCLQNINQLYVAIAGERDIINWRKIWGELLNETKEIICFSKSSTELLLKIYPNIEEKLTINPHSLDYLTNRKVLLPERSMKSEIVVGVIGNIQFNKGSEVIKDLYDYIRKFNLKIRIVVIGNLSGIFDQSILKVTGSYNHNELSNLIQDNQLDFAFMPSVWPETFSFVTHEIVAMGLPLLTFNLGAQAEVARNYKFGKTINLGPPNEIVEELNLFFQELKN
jgi:glycosyltransferase involved in cell wall biosynthesis